MVDPELAALESVLLAITQLDDPLAQRRIIDYAWDFFVVHPRKPPENEARGGE